MTARESTHWALADARAKCEAVGVVLLVLIALGLALRASPQTEPSAPRIYETPDTFSATRLAIAERSAERKEP